MNRLKSRSILKKVDFLIKKITMFRIALSTVLPAKSDSDVMFVYKVIRDLESIAHLCINPIRAIGLIHK